MAYLECVLDSARGVYIPQNFAECIREEDWTGIKPEDLDVLRAGPDAEDYWEAWQSVLDYAETKDGAVLHNGENGDLFLFYRDRAVEDLNGYFADELDYATSHRGAGDAYADAVSDAVDLQDVRAQLESTRGFYVGSTYAEEKVLDLDLRGLDAEDVLRLALDVFCMESGHIFSYGPVSSTGLILASFAVQEVEIEVPEDFSDVLDLLGDNETDAYITGTGLAYMTTDAVWYAVARTKALQDAIDAEVESRVPTC